MLRQQAQVLLRWHTRACGACLREYLRGGLQILGGVQAHVPASTLHVVEEGKVIAGGTNLQYPSRQAQSKPEQAHAFAIGTPGCRQHAHKHAHTHPLPYPHPHSPSRAYNWPPLPNGWPRCVVREHAQAISNGIMCHPACNMRYHVSSCMQHAVSCVILHATCYTQYLVILHAQVMRRWRV